MATSLGTQPGNIMSSEALSSFIPLDSGSQTTKTSPSTGQSPFSHLSSGSQTTKTTPSPAQPHSKPSNSGVQTTNTRSRLAQEPSNPTNSGINTANATSGPAATPPKKKAKTALTAEQKKDRHKRAEAVRRNQIDSSMTILRGWIPDEYRLTGKKANAKKQSLCAAANWLEQLKQGNDKLEETFNALVDAHGLVTEGYPTAQTQLQQQQFLPTTPPPLSLPSPQEQLAGGLQLSYEEHMQEYMQDYMQWDNPFQERTYEPPQQANAPPSLPTPEYMQWDDPFEPRNYEPPQQANPPTPLPTQEYSYPPLPEDNGMVPEIDWMT